MNAFVKQAGFALVGPIFGATLTVGGLAASGFINTSTQDLRIAQARQEQMFIEVMRRLERIEKKLDDSENRKAR